MQAKTPVSRNPQVVRGRILDAAQAEFREFGFSGASTNRILARFGGSKPTMFRHFPTKRSLLVGVVERTAGELSDLIDWQSVEGDTPAAWLGEFARRTVRWLLGDEALFLARLAISERAFEDIAATFHRITGQPMEAMLAGKLRDWAASGLMNSDDPEADAVCFLDLVLSGLAMRSLYLGAAPPEDFTDQHIGRSVALFLDGIRRR